MLVGYVLKGKEDEIKILDVDTQDHIEALDTVKEHLNNKHVRVLACIEGGKGESKVAA
jgi:hypothetical protein